ncbi:MAG TPA: ABC transporter transmembrane domain-containing protein, partial [Bacteroidia bacterium]|nr:ABC transporter transmembrane domain-containing protein [Bacteroidia bacterium]
LSKALLIITPTENFIKAKQIKAEKWFWLKKLIEDDMNILGIALFMGLVIAILSLTTAVFSQKLIDDILPGKKLLKLEVGLGLLFFLLLVKSFISYLRQYFLNKQSRSFNNRIISHFYGSLLHLPKSFFDNRKIGDLLARMNDTVRIQNAVSYIGANLMIDVLLLIITSVFILTYSWHLGLIALLSIPLFFLSIYIFHKQIVDNQRKVMAAYSKNESNYVDTIQGVGVIKGSNKEDLFSKITKQIYDFFQKTLFDLGTIRIRFNLATEILATVLIVAVISWGSMQVLNNELKLGQFMAVIQMVGILMPAAGRLALTNIQLQEAKVAFDRMFEYTSIHP